MAPRYQRELVPQIERYLGFWARARPEANPLILTSLALDGLPVLEREPERPTRALRDDLTATPFDWKDLLPNGEEPA